MGGKGEGGREWLFPKEGGQEREWVGQPTNQPATKVRLTCRAKEEVGSGGRDWSFLEGERSREAMSGKVLGREGVRMLGGKWDRGRDRHRERDIHAMKYRERQLSIWRVRKGDEEAVGIREKKEEQRIPIGIFNSEGGKEEERE